MATTISRIRNGHDTWLEQTRQHRGDRRLRLRDTAQFGYLYLPLGPELRNVTITSATLHLWGDGTGWGTQTLTVQRINENWDAATLSWNNKPGVAGTTAPLTQTNPTDPTEWAVNVTALVQAFASGARWYGMRLSLSSTTERGFHSLNAEARTPWLEVEWTDAPAAPVDLNPSGGLAVATSRPVLTWSNENSPDRTSITACQVQIDPNANAAAPAFDSGTVVTELAEYDLAQSAYAGLANNATTKWRVRARDDSGLWSDWSDWSTFTRVDKGTVTITTPGATVAEYTPPVAWTTSFTQTAWRVQVFAADGTVLHDTGRKAGATQDYTIPAKDSESGKQILKDTRDYLLRVSVWDSVERAKTSGISRSTTASVAFNYADDPTPDPISGLAAAQVGTTPYVDLTWARSTTPDSYTIVEILDGKDRVIETGIDGADLIVSGTSYKYRYKDGKPGAHAFKVKATVNGVTKVGPTASMTLKPLGVWVLGGDQDGKDIDVVVMGRDVDDMTMPDRGTTFVLPGSRAPVRITQGVGGYQGTISGSLTSTSGRTADEWRKRLLQLKRLGDPVTLVLGSESFRAVIFNINVTPSRDGVIRGASFEFFQVGDIDWLDD